MDRAPCFMPDLVKRALSRETQEQSPRGSELARVCLISCLPLASDLEPSGYKENVPQILPDCSRVCVCPLGQIPRPTTRDSWSAGKGRRTFPFCQDGTHSFCSRQLEARLPPQFPWGPFVRATPPHSFYFSPHFLLPDTIGLSIIFLAN